MNFVGVGIFSVLFLVSFSMTIDAFGQEIPPWIKNNAGWWADGQIDDSAFLQGIQFLIKEGIMVIPPTEASSSSESKEIPTWVKNNAGWWAQDLIGDSDFVSGIQFLIQNGIISVEQEPSKPVSRSSEKIYDVIVVGAGVSGLAAADALEDNDIDVLVLEARDRVGGRIWSHSWNGVTIDEGANWIHHSAGNPITEFAQQQGFTMIETPFTSVTFWEQEEVDDEYEYLYDDFWSYIMSTQESGADRSLAQVLDEFKDANSLTSDEEFALNYLANSFISHEYATDLKNLSRDYFDIGKEYGEGEVVFPNGYEQIIDVLKEGLDIRLEHVVFKIEYNSNGVTVYTSQGEFSSKKVLVTVPLGVLKSSDIEFSPSLPANKQSAIDELGMGLLQKHWLLFDEVFWDDDVTWIHSINEQNWECVNFTYTKKPILLCFTMGEYARNQESKPDDVIIDDIMSVLQDAYGPDIADPVDTYFTKWASDKFSYGAYSYTAVGNTPATYTAINSPVDDIIFFAGEHTHESYPATVHGAYLSGLREAERISDLG